MTNFDFTALLQFLMSLFEALKKLAEKLGFDFGGKEDTSDTSSEEDTNA